MNNMQPRPLVSVVVPFFNSEDFLAEAIDSVTQQTYENWQLLLVDDGSTDHTGEIARNYARRDPNRVIVLKHPGNLNQGISASRNLGIRKSTGEYVIFLDGDDVWMPTILEDMLRIIRENPEVALVYGTEQKWFSWAGGAEKKNSDCIISTPFHTNTPIHPPTLMPTVIRGAIGTPARGLMRKEAVLSVGGFEEEFTGMCDDLVFYAKFCLRYPVLGVDKCWYRYRQHPESSVAKAFASGTRDYWRLRYLEWLKGYLRGEMINDRDTWRTLRRELFRYRYAPRAYRWLNRIKRGLKRRIERSINS